MCIICIYYLAENIVQKYAKNHRHAFSVPHWEIKLNCAESDVSFILNRKNMLTLYIVRVANDLLHFKKKMIENDNSMMIVYFIMYAEWI